MIKIMVHLVGLWATNASKHTENNAFSYKIKSYFILELNINQMHGIQTGRGECGLDQKCAFIKKSENFTHNHYETL